MKKLSNYKSVFRTGKCISPLKIAIKHFGYLNWWLGIGCNSTSSPIRNSKCKYFSNLVRTDKNEITTTQIIPLIASSVSEDHLAKLPTLVNV